MLLVLVKSVSTASNASMTQRPHASKTTLKHALFLRVPLTQYAFTTIVLPSAVKMRQSPITATFTFVWPISSPATSAAA